MIDYFYDKKDMRKRMWNLYKVLMGQWLVLGVIDLILLLYITPAAVFGKERDAIVNGVALLVFLVFLLLLSVKIFYPFYIKIRSTFKRYAKDGLLHYSFFIRDSKYVIKCIESEIEFEFAKEDIKKISRKNGLMVIVINPNYVADLPDREDIYNLFQS